MKTDDRSHTGISARAGWWIFAVLFGGLAVLLAIDAADGQFYHQRQDVTAR